MKTEINNVISGSDKIFDTVINSDASQIENFIIVTFNDPGEKLRVKTTDRDEFKNSLKSIEVGDGGDCSELAMAGIELGLQLSLPNSYVYVITDASAKDYDKFEEVKNLAMNKGVQIVFLITNMCPGATSLSPGYQVYEKLAEATSGQIFQLKKNQVQKILDYVARVVESRKTEIIKKNLPPGYGHKIDCILDSTIKNIDISITGIRPSVNITDPDGKKVETKDIVDISKVKVVNVVDPKPGVHNIEVGSLSDTSVVVLGTTNVNFQYGFSIIKPSSNADTTNRPIPDRKSYLSIKLITKGEKITLSKIQLLDMKDNVILEEPVWIVNAEDQFYTSEPITPPRDIFKIVIIGVNDDTKESIKRVSGTPVEQQKIFLEHIENKPPIASIMEKPKLVSNYGNPLQLKCSVFGYPEPKILWQDKFGSSIKFTVNPKKLPYEYISVLDIDHVHRRNTFFCKASNYLGSDEKSVEVELKPYFEVVNISKDKTVEFNKEETLYCIVNSSPPANITWYLNGNEIEIDDNINITPDRSTVLIKHMQPKFAGRIICEVRNDIYRGLYNIQLSVTGVEVPKIDKTVTEVSVSKDSSVDISCRVLKGKPSPTIHWFFKREKSNMFNQIEEYSENLHIENVNIHMAGTYKCIAKNEIDRDTHVVDLLVEYVPVIKGRRNIEIIEKIGQPITIPCLVDGLPIPHITWSLNGTEITDGDGYRIYRDKTLKLKASVEKMGQYTCKAVNKLGSAEKAALVQVFEPVALDVPKETNLKVKVGSNLVLTCPVKGYPNPTIKWLFVSSITNKTKEVDVAASFEFPRIQLTDGGTYICEAQNLGGSVRLAYSVRVDAPPAIFTKTTNIKAVLGDRVIRIPCWTTGNPKPEIIWRKDGNLIAIGSEWYSVDTDDTLIVKNVNRDSAGTYACIAKNILNTLYETFRVTVKDYPSESFLNNKIYLEENKPAEVDCIVPHERTDQVWWFKSSRKIAEGKLFFPKVKNNNHSVYKCRVSNFVESKTGTILIEVGYKPRFTYEASLQSYLFDHENVHLHCSNSAKPKANITWWFHKNKLGWNEMTYIFDRKVSSIGEYVCVVENMYGKIERKFNVTAKDCLLDIQMDLDRYHPLVLTESLRLSNFQVKDGHLAIPIGEFVQFYCPGGFNKFRGTEVKAMCTESKIFKINEQFEQFPKIKCVEGMEPVTRKTGKPCAYENTEMIKIGIDVKGDFLEIYEICYHNKLKIPLYAHYRLISSAAGVKSIPTKTLLHYDFLNYNIDDMYDCEQQKNHISTILGRPFHIDDHCCFAARQLVNEKDVAPGLPQISTHSYLNIIPHWSSCNMKNWNKLEELLRLQVQTIKRALSITTGTSLRLQLPVGASSVYVHLKDNAGVKSLVPQFIWKVIKDHYTMHSVAVIQINMPDLNIDEANKYKICPDICSEILWMNGIDWGDVKNGFMYCCSILEFESAFGYKAQFSQGYGEVLKYFDY